MSDITYCGCVFYPLDETGVPHLDYKHLWAYVGYCITMVCLIVSTLIKHYLKIKQHTNLSCIHDVFLKLLGNIISHSCHIWSENLQAGP